MPRKARIDAPGALHHIICRGIERQNIFWTDEDRNNFVERLGSILDETDTGCYAWALLPNHFHLLLRTGITPISTIMKRLLTGYVVTFNRRHRRNGHLFQNRFKSILCQENPYFLELIRYIHLNPLRAKVVQSMTQLDHYQYCGHSVLMGHVQHEWQDVNKVLNLFAKRFSTARKQYRAFAEKGISMGRRPDLIGGGLIRSAGGWKAFKSEVRNKGHLKGDERILGNTDFVKSVLATAEENLNRRYRLQAEGMDFNRVVERVCDLLNIDSNEIFLSGKQPMRVRAKSLVCYWAVKELGMTGTNVSKLISLTQPAVSKAVQRGEKFAKENKFNLES